LALLGVSREWYPNDLIMSTKHIFLNESMPLGMRIVTINI